MSKSNTITVYEHQKLSLNHEGFDKTKMKALLGLNDLNGGKYLEGLANGVRFKQYVGIIQIDGLTIEILPKIDQEENNYLWRNFLIQMLKRSGRLKVNDVGDAQVKRQNYNLLEIYFEYYLKEIQNIQRKGLIKEYRKETKNVNILKGKLEFAGHIKRNLIHKENFFTSHQVYDKNHLLHQVLFAALKIVKEFSNGTKLNDLCNRIIFDFPKMDSVVINEKTLNNIVINKKTINYDKALDLAKLIILNYSPNITKGKHTMLALLFDMNALWERYIISELRKIQNNSIKVYGKENKPFWGNNKLEPDIILEINNEKIILDTKWKRPGLSPSSNDIRQMYAYARFWNAEKTMLLYPGTNSSKNKFTAYLNKNQIENHQCSMNFVSIIDDKGYLKNNIGNEIIELLS